MRDRYDAITAIIYESVRRMYAPTDKQYISKIGALYREPSQAQFATNQFTPCYYLIQHISTIFS